MPTLRFGKVWQVIRHFGVLFFAIKVPLKQLYLNLSPRYILLPHIFPHMVTSTMFPVDKNLEEEKSLGQQCINSFLAHTLSHDCWLWFYFFGRLRVPNRRCDLVVPADWEWGRGNESSLR